MKLFTNDEIRAIERYTIEQEGISLAELIERVAEGVTDEICARWRSITDSGLRYTCSTSEATNCLPIVRHNGTDFWQNIRR